LKNNSQTGRTPEERKLASSFLRHYLSFFGGVPAILLICITGVVIYSNSFECAFQFDDITNIIHNAAFPELTDFEGWWRYSKTRLTAFYSFALNIHLHGYEVWGFHFVNLMIHLITSCLVWYLTILIYSTPALKENRLSKYKYEIAFFTGLLFVSHPLATQSVTYIVQRMASMLAMFYLGTLVFYIKARLMDARNSKQYLMYALSLISLLLAFLTKQNAYTLPFAILLIEFYFFEGLQFKKQSLLKVKSLFIIGGIAVLGILLSQSFSFNVFNPLPPIQGQSITITPGNYLCTQFSVILKYIQLLVLPVNQMVDYDFRIAAHFFEGRTLMDFSLLCLIGLLGIVLFKNNRVASFGIFWFFLTLSIESSIIPIRDVIFEHRTYLPSFGFFLFVSSMIYNLENEKSKQYGILIMTMVVVLNSYLTYQRNKVWKDPVSLWQDNVQKAPGLSRPLANLAHAHALKQNYQKSIELLNKALTISPGYINAYFDRGVSYGHLQNYTQAIADYTKTIELKPDYADAYLNRGAAYDVLQQWKNALGDYSAALKYKPKSAIAYLNRGSLYIQLEQWLEALEDLNKAIALDSSLLEAYDRRGYLYEKLRNMESALDDYTALIRLDPENPGHYKKRAQVYYMLTDVQKALSDYSTAIRIHPNDPGAFMARAKLYFETAQYQQSIDDYSAVLKLDTSNQEAHTQRELAMQKLKKSK
jgi:protein O-mannosyl-transferase